MDDRIPVRLSENPNSFVSVARKEPATNMEIKYSKVASKVYSNLLRFMLFAEMPFIYNLLKYGQFLYFTFFIYHNII